MISPSFPIRAAAETATVWSINSDQRVVFCNEAFRRALEIETSPWEGRPVVEVLRHSDLLGLTVGA